MTHIWIGKIVKGYRHSLFEDGKINDKNLRKTTISKDDLLEGVRMEINSDTLDGVKQIFYGKDRRDKRGKKTNHVRSLPNRFKINYEND